MVLKVWFAFGRRRFIMLDDNCASGLDTTGVLWGDPLNDNYDWIHR